MISAARSICLVAALAAFSADGSRLSAVEVHQHDVSSEGNEKPMEEISIADGTAAAHLSNMNSAKMEALKTLQDAMAEAVKKMSLELKGEDVIPLNKATEAANEAKALQVLVASHKTNTIEFFKAVDLYKDKEDERSSALALQQALADDSSASDQARHEELLNTMEGQVTKLYCQQLHTKLSLIQKILKQFKQMKGSYGEIQEQTQPKDKEHETIIKGKSDVNSQVEKGLGAAHDWANTELLDVCNTLQPGSPVMEEFTFLADLVTGIEGSGSGLLKETSTCNQIVKAVIQYFQGAIEEVDEKRTLPGAFAEKCGIQEHALDEDLSEFDDFKPVTGSPTSSSESEELDDEEGDYDEVEEGDYSGKY